MAIQDETIRTTQRSTESDLLLLCARTHIDASTIERIQHKVNENIDWARLTDLTLAHRVLPLVYWSLNKACPEKVPPQILQQYQHLAGQITRRNLFLASVLTDLLRQFEQNNLPVIPYKGPLLAQAAYGSISLRQFGDLDLFVREEEAPRAIELLRSLAYRQGEMNLSWQTHLVREDDLVGLDLHWRLTTRRLAFPLSFEQLWSRLQPITLTSMEIHTLSLEDALIIRCQDSMDSYFKPGWPDLHWICDVAELANREELNWDDVLMRAQQLRSQCVLYFCLSLAGELLDTALPLEVRQRAKADPQVEMLLQIARQRIFHEDERQHFDPHKSTLRRHVFTLRAKEFVPLPASWTYPLIFRAAPIYARLRPDD